MSQSLCQIYIHLIFSTKKRIEWLKPDIREFLKKYRIEYDERYVWD